MQSLRDKIPETRKLAIKMALIIFLVMIFITQSAKRFSGNKEEGDVSISTGGNIQSGITNITIGIKAVCSQPKNINHK